jgi:threonine dehydratase
MAPWTQPGLDGVDVASVVERVRSHVRPTTFIESERLDRAVGNGVRVLLVSETFQHTGSFKFRAAMSVSLHTKATKLLTASSGNFGAALAAAAARTGKACTVVMPAKSAEVKVAAVRSYGATVDLIDTAKVTRAARVEELHRADPSAMLASPYDDPHVIAGNASLGWEILTLPPERYPDVVVAPVGGGGLSSGVVVARNWIGASRPVWGAEPLAANDAARSFRSGHLESNAEDEPPTICDGARTASLGKRNWEILHSGRGLEGIVEADDSTVGAAVRLLFTAANLKAEPTGALSLGAVLTAPEKFSGKRVACVVSGGNVDVELYCTLVRKP